MGGVSEAWIEAQERGWSAPDTHVCADCVEDPFLQKLIDANATARACDYCGRKGRHPLTAPAEVVVKAVFNAVHAYYCEPANGGVPYDGGYLIDPIGIEEVLSGMGLAGHVDFIKDVIESECNGDGFVPAANGYWADSHEHEILSGGWALFCHRIKHETRFHFARPSPDESDNPNDLPPSRMLSELGRRLRPLLQTLPAGTLVYRVRIRKRGETWKPSAASLGAPPPDKTSAGRMNPAGIPYLYTSFDPATARKELRLPDRTSKTVFTGQFKLAQPLQVIDLTALPDPPSIFDVARKDEREGALFVREFVDTITEPVAKDGREHIDYVPSQVVCEYLAQVFQTGTGEPLGGLVFGSSVHPGGKNLVVFPDDRWRMTFHGVTFSKHWKGAPRAGR